MVLYKFSIHDVRVIVYQLLIQFWSDLLKSHTKLYCSSPQFHVVYNSSIVFLESSLIASL